MTFVAEACFEYSFDGNITVNADPTHDYEGWKFHQRGFMDTEPQPGDFIVALVVCRTDSAGDFVPNLRVVDAAGDDRTDWTRDFHWEFDDDGSGFTALDPSLIGGATPIDGHYAVALFRKEWTSGDDFSTYEAWFPGYNNLVGAETGSLAEVQIVMYCAHGGDGVWAFDGGQKELAYTSAFAGALRTFNYGDGQSRMGNLEHDPESDTWGVWGYHPGTALGYYEFTGCNIYFGAQFGTWSFGVFDETGGFYGSGAQTFEPYDTVDQDWDGPAQTPTTGRPVYETFSLFLLDVKAEGAIRISHNKLRARRLMVS
jgi:hypothetical protein